MLTSIQLCDGEQEKTSMKWIIVKWIYSLLIRSFHLFITDQIIVNSIHIVYVDKTLFILINVDFILISIDTIKSFKLSNFMKFTFIITISITTPPQP